LFAVLHRAVVAEGIPIECGCTIGPDDARLSGHDVIVDAMGANSTFSANQVARRALDYGALWINLPWPGKPFRPDCLDQRYTGAASMAGLMPIGWVDAPERPQAAFFWSLRRQDLQGWRQSPFSQWLGKIHAIWPEVAPLLENCGGHEACTFAAYDHFTRRRPYRGNSVQIGDSAHATSPQLGQGANMALLDALALAVALREQSDIGLALRQYASMRRWHVRLFQWASALFTPFYQSDSRVLPVLRDRILAPLTQLPPFDRFVARLVAGMTVAPLRGRAFQPLGVLRCGDQDAGVGSADTTEDGS
jgi:salicylate hydroxylase